ncbi:MAG: hypothetical protein ACI8X5_003279 [Planctomycetota bacterium]|jgi:hypothetical protein
MLSLDNAASFSGMCICSIMVRRTVRRSTFESLVPNFPVPLHLGRIPQQELDHGDTRNQ